MKLTAILTVLLASALACGQPLEVANVSATGCPLALSSGVDGEFTAVMARNNSSKSVVAVVAVTTVTDVSGHALAIISTQDYLFKLGAIEPGKEREIAAIQTSELDASVTHAVGAVRFVQFDDGTTWGDPGAAKEMIAERPEKLAFLEHIVEVYDTRGEASFNAALNEPKPISGRFIMAMCLKSDADGAKIARIDLARTRLRAAQKWQESGIF